MDDAQQSNVLFVVLDTVRKDRLGPYGYERETTPELSAFAEEATVFESAVAPAPWTLPVHASLFTGRYPSQHGADQGSPYLEGDATLATALSAAGYDTACYSSNAWITPYTGLTEGFDAQDSFFEVLPGDVLSGPLASAWQTVNDNDYLRDLASKLVRLGAMAHEKLASGEGADTKTPSVIDRTKSFIDDSESDEGWFAFVNLMDAHLPYYPPEEYREEFAPGVDPSEVCQNSKEYNSGARDIDDEEWDDIRSLYDAEIAHMDAELGRLFDWLRETGQWEETTVVVCADHGELHGEHDLYGHEFALYDQLINVPLLVKHPALEADRRDDLVELLDCYHTVLEALDVDPDDALAPADDDISVTGRDPTRSLLSDEYRAFEGVSEPDPGQQAVLDAEGGEASDDSEGRSPSSGRTQSNDDYAFVEYAQPVIELHHLEEKASEAGIELPDDHRAYSRLRAARSTDAKYARADRIPDEGYRLDEDPAESTPVDPVDDGVVADTERALARFEQAAGGAWIDPSETDAEDADALAEADEETRDRLRELGYLE
ncbi:sulfatase [Haloterrigena turkmenica DSM 5511]|uniref:Sulfatase n=1 Tax=Haloterrigena turkmenica (strain ATCC 51198 / DSM 5511 / JCM 9101 / NCIMB 13204 / VKM B-1734 / 4k) TaxID=543526 RepID=D2RQK4_HALTV|nr:sulfatase [Haloterrigena turkmenica]ADB62381.1 sulfatase [Haloterrigena turkmenica DSM 5511]